MMQLDPVDLKEIEQYASNIYEAIVAAAKKARNINEQNKLEYNTLVSNLIGTEDEFDETENPDLLKISIEFEKREKPHLQSLKMLFDSELKFEYKIPEESAE